MTDRPDDIGYKFMLAFEGKIRPPAHIVKWLRGRRLGGFSLFRPYNYETPEQLRGLTAWLQWAAAQAGQPPLLIATDQEGGQLTALGAGTTQFAGNMALAATRDPELARRVGRAIGLELAAVGVNINYGPVADLNTNPANPGLGIRTFGDDPALTAAMVAATVEGLQSAGVAATVKHFPGTGDLAVDAHYQLAVSHHGRERLEAVELVPFRAGTGAGAKLLMSGHVAVPALGGSAGVPSTISREVMTDFARGALGFDGVTITDALDMGAITQGAGQIVDVIAAVRAGVDLLLVMPDPEVEERLYQGVRHAYTRALIDDGHLDGSIERILDLKRWAGSQEQPDLDVVGCIAHHRLEDELACRSITLVRDTARLLPLRPEPDARIAAVMPQPTDLTPADTSKYVRPQLADALRLHHPYVDEFIPSQRPTDEEITALRDRLAGYDLLVIGTISASLQPEQAALANALLGLGIPAVTVALRTPYDLGVYPQSQTHLCTYSIHPPSLDALARALFGELSPTGVLPVRATFQE